MSVDETGTIMGVMIFYIAMIAFFILIYWKIWSKAGFNGAWSLLMLIPLVNIGSLIYLAFADWPALKNQVSPSTFE